MKRLLTALFLFFAGVLLAGPAGAQVIVIANSGVKAASVSKADLRDVFTGASSTLKDGSHVTPVLLKGGAAHDEFLASCIGRNDGAFRAGWRSLVFSGQATMPRQFDTEAALVDYVAHNPGTIGYIAKSTPHDGVKVLELR